MGVGREEKTGVEGITQEERGRNGGLGERTEGFRNEDMEGFGSCIYGRLKKYKTD